MRKHIWTGIATAALLALGCGGSVELTPEGHAAPTGGHGGEATTIDAGGRGPFGGADGGAQAPDVDVADVTVDVVVDDASGACSDANPCPESACAPPTETWQGACTCAGGACSRPCFAKPAVCADAGMQ